MEINVNLKSKSYKVIIEKGILSKVNNFINKDKKILIGENTGDTYKIGDRINIKVKDANKLLRTIDFKKV